MVRAYRLLAWCTLGPLFAYLWWRGRKDADYRLRWRERLGFTDGMTAYRHGIVLHCASVGEVIAARPLVELLLAEPHWGPLVVTCSTPTGSRQLRKDFGDRVGHVYFPLDLAGATRRFLACLQPRLVVLMERELWPEFLHQAQIQGIPVALVNARLSERSAASYLRWRCLMAPALASLRSVCAEDAATARRLRALGVPEHRLQITGNIKSDVQAGPALRHAIADLRTALGPRPVLTAGSTHAGEDEALIAAFVQHLAHRPDTLLILVPRHPERFDLVASLLSTSGLRFARVSLGQAVHADTQVLLGDSMGELMRWYGVADACFIGGSLVPRQGHNPLEALCLDKPLLTGPAYGEFRHHLPDAGGRRCAVPSRRCRRGVHAFSRLAPGPGIAAGARRARPQAHPVADGSPGPHAQRIAAPRAGLRPQCPARRPAHGPPRQRHGLGRCRRVRRRPSGAVRPRCMAPARQPWQELGAGRGNIHTLSDQRGNYLLRHYYRGGLMARLSRDLFLAQPIPHSRAMQEFSLLRVLRVLGLPVPQASPRATGGWVSGTAPTSWSNRSPTRSTPHA